MKKNQIETLIDEAQELADGQDPRRVAQDLVRGLPEHFLRRIAVQFIVERLRDRGRRMTLLAERRAMREQLMQEMTTIAPPPGRAWRLPTATRTPEQQAELDEIGYQCTARMASEIREITDRFVKQMRVEWTAELLDSTFALTDGTLVLWGDATLDQHRERVAIFTRNAAANLEGAARHEAAIQSLEQSGADTLRQMLTAA